MIIFRNVDIVIDIIKIHIYILLVHSIIVSRTSILFSILFFVRSFVGYSKKKIIIDAYRKSKKLPF